jgi:transcriptional regulator with XRE-family HTH domain
MVRDVRRARKLSQAELATSAGVGRDAVSRLERGLVEGLSIGTVRCVSRALGMPSLATLGWRGPEVDRLRDQRHAGLVERVGRMLVELGWRFEPEYTFNFYGERGAVDALAWHAERQTLLLGEIKTRIWDLQDLFSVLDRKRRIVPPLLERERKWRAVRVGVVLFMPERSTHRHLIERHSATFDSRLPDRQVRVRRWLAEPVGGLNGVYFLPDSGQIDRRKVSGEPHN